MYGDVSDKPTNWRILMKRGLTGVTRTGVKVVTDEESTRKNQETMGKDLIH